MATNEENFRASYITALQAQVEAHPDRYFYGIDKVPKVATKMVAALKNGTANIHDSYAIRTTCKLLGIKCRRGDIKNYLNGEN